MDRSFLTDKNVVAASRKFVCIRLATYEDKSESQFLKRLYVGRSGQMENTTFAILSPNAKRTIVSAGRGPFRAFRDANEMARQMNTISSKFTNEGHVGSALPTMKSVELALNVAASDNLPLIITVNDSSGEFEKSLLDTVWQTSYAGQFVFAEAKKASDLNPVPGAEFTTGLLVVEPDQFGVVGTTKAHFSTPPTEMELLKTLQKIVADHPRKTKNHRNHTQLGIRLGMDWQTAIPVTDRQSIQAKKRARGIR